jgi:hypothetical protein
MRGFEFGEKLPDWPELSFFLVVEALADAFFRIGSRGNIQQTLGSLARRLYLR